MRLEESVTELIATQFPEVFIVELAHLTAPHDLIRIAADTDAGIRLEQCEAIHRKVIQLLDDRFPELNCSVEVSSPGVGKPLKLHRQYVKNTGRTLKVITLTGDVAVGILRRVGEAEIEIDEPISEPGDKPHPAAKLPYRTRTFPLSELKEARVEITF